MAEFVPTPDAPRTVPAGEYSTVVQFPRFQEETARHMGWLATPQPWVDPEAVQDMLNPQLVVSERKGLSLKGKWWGVYHRADEQITHSDIYSEEAIDDGQAHIYRLRLLDHDYEWDAQAVRGRTQQVVLEQLVDDWYLDVAALMVEGPSFRKSQWYFQRFVARDDEGNWAGPNRGQLGGHEKTWTYLAIMRDIGASSVSRFEADAELAA